MGTKRNIIEIDEDRCDGCGMCVTACSEGAIEIVNGKARVISEAFCDGLGACIKECPRNALRIIEREAEPFDEKAVNRHLQEQKRLADAMKLSAQCPSARERHRTIQSGKNENDAAPSLQSALMNWPVQLRLVSEHAMFLKCAHLLVVSHCVPFAYPDFHRHFMRNRVVLSGCPKFDDREWYVEKFAEIFRHNDIQSVTVLVMEVPCCQAMPVIVSRGMDAAKKIIPNETVIIGIEGEVIKRVRSEQ